MMYLPSMFRKRFADDFFHDFMKLPIDDANAPASDIKEFDDHYEFDIELPGYDKDDVKAEVKDGYLIVEAKHSEEKDKKDKEGNFIQRERRFGSYSRSFYIGKQYKKEDFDGHFEKGLLTLSLPKKEKETLPEDKKYIDIS